MRQTKATNSPGQRSEYSSKLKTFFRWIDILYHALFIRIFVDFKKRQLRILLPCVLLCLALVALVVGSAEVRPSGTMNVAIVALFALLASLTSFTMLKFVGFFSDRVYNLRLTGRLEKTDNNCLLISSLIKSSGNKFAVLSSIMIMIAYLYVFVAAIAISAFDMRDSAKACLGDFLFNEQIYALMLMPPGLGVCDPSPIIGLKLMVYLTNGLVVGTFFTEMTSIVYRRSS